MTTKLSAQSRNKWSLEDDEILKSCIYTNPFNSLKKRFWTYISQQLKEYGLDKNSRQCRQRWNEYLNPKLNNTEWSDAKTHQLFGFYKIYGSHWSRIAAHFEGKSSTFIKNTFFLSLRKCIRQINRSTCRPINPKLIKNIQSTTFIRFLNDSIDADDQKIRIFDIIQSQLTEGISGVAKLLNSNWQSRIEYLLKSLVDKNTRYMQIKKLTNWSRLKTEQPESLMSCSQLICPTPTTLSLTTVDQNRSFNYIRTSQQPPTVEKTPQGVIAKIDVNQNGALNKVLDTHLDSVRKVLIEQKEITGDQLLKLVQAQYEANALFIKMMEGAFQNVIDQTTKNALNSNRLN